jgi:hypothetical protein
LYCLAATALLLQASGDKPAPQPDAHRVRGLSYLHDVVEEAPWSIHVLKIDRSRTDYEFHTTLAKGTALGLSTLSEQIKSLPRELGQPLGAINGDFWKDSHQQDGDPTGLQIMEGELVSGPCARVCFWMDAAGQPHATNVLAQFQVTAADGATAPFGLNEERTNNGAVLFTPAFGISTHTRGGRELVLECAGDGPADWLPLRAGKTYPARVREVRETGDTPLARDRMVLSLSPQCAERFSKLAAGSVLKLSTATTPDVRDAKTAIGGGPMLVHGGKAATFGGSQPRHPRTALGWNDKFFFLLVVDGRQSNLSVGMSLPELAAYLVKLGCTEAMNLDGGGSSTIWVRGQVMNSPCYGSERAMANALVLVQKPKTPGGAQPGSPP